MALESRLFAFLLWQFSRNFGPIVDGSACGSGHGADRTPRVLTFIGRGYMRKCYSVSGCSSAVRRAAVVRLPKVAAVSLAAVVAALAFAAAHHVGPYGEPMRTDFFVFRTIAGLYFTLLFVARGFGIAVGAHAGYDVLVGVAVW